MTKKARRALKSIRAWAELMYEKDKPRAYMTCDLIGAAHDLEAEINRLEVKKRSRK